MAHITIVVPCFNEEENVQPLYERLVQITEAIPRHAFSFLFIDNASSDRTRAILRELAAQDRRVKAIFNVRNFGHIRSPYYGLIQAPGDAAFLMAADFQDPPDLLPQFIAEWEKGFPLVLGIKNQSQELPLMYSLRTLYYRMLGALSDVPLNENSTGFGLYDRKVLDSMRAIPEPYPYLRGLVCELGYPTARVPFTQPVRRRGITKNNFYTLYDIAMLGFVSHSKLPLRLMTMSGFALGLVSLLISFVYLLVKLIFWSQFSLGLAPVLIGVFFFGSIQLFCMGILGEYIGSIHTKVSQRPLVVEQERLNF